MLTSSHRLHGVFRGSRAVAEGLAGPEQLKSGLHRRLLRDVYADPSLTATHRLYAHGAMLTLPADAVLGGGTTAAWFGAPFASAADPVLVLAPPDATWRGPRGVRVHRTDVPAANVLTLEDDLGVVRVTDAARTAWDVAALETVATA